MQLTEKQRADFNKWGYLLLPDIIPADKTLAARQDIHERLAARGLREQGKWRFDKLPKTIVPIGVSKILGKTAQSAVYGSLATREILDLVSRMVEGRPLYSPRENGQVLFSYPNAEKWALPAAAWHLDVSRLPGFDLPGVQMFAFINQVVKGGGGTLVVAGSHHFFNENKRISSKQVRKKFGQYPYFKELMDENSSHRQHFMDEVQEVDGIDLQVKELYGNAGDVYLMDMRLLHTIAPNAAKEPRMMMTKRFFIRAAYVEMYGEIS